ncbi:uncharacterized protein MELLADRAFT_94696 [Melampsora larici-populina 98AG31]|uniref:Secreted protein n=1 Tax=Melampsora larici-populina (strain 98AG31 / pathotype 3-4-7) TaxID=747676 RepID=F4S7M4_MELLP|nr:uncharacterized protein MELLADRAFT_94696 [Melampsora larici-populina 98AG31]EGF99346.1 hypothetical protein MELLADRAFT_94696 [Melampsora larici-populina 98AG31]
MISLALGLSTIPLLAQLVYLLLLKVVTNAPNVAGSVPLLSNPYVAGNKNKTAAECRARIMAWTSKPDKPADPNLHLKWREDVRMWNNWGNAPLNFTPNSSSSNAKPHYHPYPKPPKCKPHTPNQPPPRASPPALNPFVTPFVPTRPKSPPVKVEDPPPTFSSNAINVESTNVVDLEPEPVPKTTNPVEPPLDAVIEECIKKYGDKAVLFWFAKKVDLSEEIRRVGRYVPSSSSANTIASLTQHMVESLYEHWSVFDPNSEKEVHARVCLVRRLKSLVAHFIMHPPSSEPSNPSTSSSDKGKNCAFH